MENLSRAEPFRYEIIQGETVMLAQPSMKHIRIGKRIFRMFEEYLHGKRCEAFTDNVDVHLADDLIFKPDVSIVCKPDIIKENGIFGAPDLVVEILSPASARFDRTIKKQAYERNGVKEYWIVSPGDESIEVYQLSDDGFELAGVYVIYPDWQWEQLDEEQRAKAQLSLKISLYDDFIIDIREIFSGI